MNQFDSHLTRFHEFYIDGVYYIRRETTDFVKIGQKYLALFMRPKYSAAGDINLPQKQFLLNTEHL
jgi:hypothetical protein